MLNEQDEQTCHGTGRIYCLCADFGCGDYWSCPGCVECQITFRSISLKLDLKATHLMNVRVETEHLGIESSEFYANKIRIEYVDELIARAEYHTNERPLVILMGKEAFKQFTQLIAEPREDAVPHTGIYAESKFQRCKEEACRHNPCRAPSDNARRLQKME